MKSEWYNKKIGDIVDIRRGASPRPIHKYISKTGMPWVKIADATSSSSKYLEKTNEYINHDGINKSVLVEPGNLIVSNSATPGLPKIMKITACVHDGWLVFSNYRETTRDFLYYKFIDIRQNLINQSNGSVFQNLKTDIVKDFNICIPNVKTQNKIVRILSKIDEKIELNNSINNNLEQQAMAIFKSWFVNFEPFDDELPSYWKNEKLGNVCSCVLGGTPSRVKSEYWNGTIPWINSSEVNNFRIIKPSETITELGLSKSATKLLPAKTTVIAITGATLGKVSLLEIDACANQSVVGIIPNDDYPYEYIYPLIKQNINELTSHKTGGAQQHINKQNVESLDILVPTASDLVKYCTTVHNLYEMIANNCFENEHLMSLRDALLPKLMSGELDVSNIDI